MRIVIPLFVVFVSFARVTPAVAQEQLQWPVAAAPSSTDAGWPVANGAPTDSANPSDRVHQLSVGWLLAGGGVFLASYAAKIPGAVILGDEYYGARDWELSINQTGCWDQTAMLLSLPVVGGLLGLVSGYQCHNTGYVRDLSGSNVEYVPQRLSPFGKNPEQAAAAWVAFGVDLIGIAFTVIGLVGHDAFGWEDVTTHEVAGHSLRASLGAPGADVGGLSVSLEL